MYREGKVLRSTDRGKDWDMDREREERMETWIRKERKGWRHG